MKKKVRKKILIILLLISVSINMFFIFNKSGNIYSEDTSSIVKNEKTLSMMIEQTAGAGDYVKTEASSWPTDGYLFNSTLSKCENGGEVAWDSDNNTVLMMGNSSDKCYIYFDKYSLIKINNYSITSSGNSVTVTIDASSGTGTISKYYYSKDNGATYIDSTNNTYTFSGLSKGTYNIKAYIVDSNNKSSSIVSKSIEITTIPFATYIKSLYTGMQGENSLYHHDGTLTNGIDDGSYRYAGASSDVNNYVCFGSDADTCPTDNLYRIIGVFGDQVKLIKATSIGDMQWASNKKNTWSAASLNTYLNGTYLTNLGNYANKIAQTTWKVGGNSQANVALVVPATAYQNEIVNPVTTNSTDNATEYSGKIGLMYVSDYYYAAGPSAWTKPGYISSGADYRSVTGINWLYLGSIEWTISRRADNSIDVFNVWSNGFFSNYEVGVYSFAVRPSFYLISSTAYAGGSGSSINPYRIN